VSQETFWEALDRLVAEHRLVLDRPKGSRHPRYPEVVYPLDYGYLDGTTASDGGGIDVWAGSLPERTLTAVLLTVDMLKRDTEMKLVLGCTEDESQTALDFLNKGSMRAILVRRPSERTQEIANE
jgi:inorganic pyrophosphatase